MNVFWFKRDLRLRDHPALAAACENPKPLLLLYIFEPILLEDGHYSSRHFNFIHESLLDLQNSLRAYNTEILICRGEALEVFSKLHATENIETLYSSRETGLIVSYERDKELSKWSKDKGIEWREFQQNGVLRGRSNRDDWRKQWYDYMSSKLMEPTLQTAHFIDIDTRDKLKDYNYSYTPNASNAMFQKGGRAQALVWKSSFFSERLAYYSKYISKPEGAFYGCSRLSPYIAWGNLSIREIYQEAVELKKNSSYKKELNAFMSRLRWQSHFIQKYEMEPRMEYEAVNKGYLTMPQPNNDAYIDRFKAGMTGYPLVDASIRAVKETGYINFRMRAMITSFFCHHLFQPFTAFSKWLAQQFLDFEPGIHYGQLQMQAGLTGINTIRIYNPTKNAQEHDSEAIFIKHYLPELRQLPNALAITPWAMTAMEASLYNFNYGSDYPERIVDIGETRPLALKTLYAYRKTAEVKRESARILQKHTMRSR